MTQPSTRPQAVAALRQIARALSTAWDVDTLLDLIARKTTEVMHVDSCSIYLLDPDQQTLRLRGTTGLDRHILGIATLKVGEGMTGYAVRQNQPIHAADAPRSPHFKWVEGSAEAAFKSLLAVPMLIDDRPIGALNVQTIAPHNYTPDEVEILALIGDLAAGALAKAQLHDQQQRQIAELQALAKVSEVVTSPQYLDDILDVVTAMAARVMSAAVCAIFLLNEAGTHLELRSAKRTTSVYRHRPPLPLGRGVVGRVALTGQPIYVRDVRQDPAYLSGELARHEGLVSLLAVPLSVREQVIGVMNCYTAAVREFTPEQEAMFLTLANQTALAIENARLVTNAAIVREMNHRIKNNLQTVAMLMQIQLADADHLNARQVLEMSIHRVHSIAAVHDVLSERGFHLVDLKEVLQRLAHMTMASLTTPHRPVTITIAGETVMLPGRAATNLALVVNELVQNALDHAFPGRETGRITITLGQAPDTLVLVVRDDGVGLPAGYRPGLGTEIVTTLTHDELQGELAYLPAPAGTTVHIRIPRHR